MLKIMCMCPEVYKSVQNVINPDFVAGCHENWRVRMRKKMQYQDVDTVADT